VIFLISGDCDFTGFVNKFKMEGYKDIVLFHKHDSSSILLQDATYTLEWSIIRKLHTISMAEKLKHVPIPLHFRHAIQEELSRRPEGFPTRSVNFLSGLDVNTYHYPSVLAILCRVHDIGWVVGEHPLQ
jgi:hypothetical protein